MKNSLRVIRKARGLKLRDLQELSGYAFQTIGNYENSARELPTDFLEKMAKVLKVPPEQIAAEPTMREEATPYRVTAIAIDLLPVPVLDVMVKAFSSQLPGAREPESGKILHSLFSLQQELNRRGHTTKGISSGLTAEEEEAASGVEELDDRERAQREQKLPTPEPGGGKGLPSTSASSGTKGPHRATPGKVQK